MKKTKTKLPGRFWKKSKFIEDDYQTDLSSIIDFYKEKGYRDARIISDTVVTNENLIKLKIDINEGKKYYFGDISFLGNTVYSDDQLSKLLGLFKGDSYNGVLLKKRIADSSKPDGTNRYITIFMYLNDGFVGGKTIFPHSKTHLNGDQYQNDPNLLNSLILSSKYFLYTRYF